MNEFSDSEMESLRSLIPIADQIKQEADYRAARKLVLTTWRTGIIFISSVLAAIIVLREQAQTLVSRLLGLG